jgi:hypothetical protein
VRAAEAAGREGVAAGRVGAWKVQGLTFTPEPSRVSAGSRVVAIPLRVLAGR